MQFTVINKTTGEELAKTPLMADTIVGSEIRVSVDTTSLSLYYYGGIAAFSQLDKTCNKFRILIKHILSPTSENPDYALAMKVYAKKNETIEAWGQGEKISFSDGKLSGFTTGTDSCSMNSCCYNDNCISVGAFISRKFFYSADDKRYYHTQTADKGDMTDFSSFCIKDDGTSLPHVVAPGSFIISSFNSAARHSDEESFSVCDSVTDNGKTYYWGNMEGTSMACPVVTGVIATWLQCKPSLTIDEIKEILQATATDDWYVKKHHHIKSGWGKIDAHRTALSAHHKYREHRMSAESSADISV